ncbi:MAG TPA: hypothetical protein VFN89_03300 [Solirubrobacterales bacterium]|nr:hypothetical protein [Solirubrobacterales bacterium]
MRNDAAGGRSEERAGASTLLELPDRVREPSEQRRLALAVLEAWLKVCPAGPIALGQESEPVLSALARGWASSTIHAFAAGPLTIPEATAAIGRPDREPMVASRVQAMESVGLLAASPTTRTGEAERLEATDWLRRGMGPLAAAARLEAAEGREDATQIDELDVEAAFLLSLPLVRGLPEEMSSSCRLTVMVPGRRPRLAGVAVLIERGKIASVSPDLTLWSDTYASGAALDWLDTLIDPSSPKLDVGGALDVPLALLDGLHEALFGL